MAPIRRILVPADGPAQIGTAATALGARLGAGVRAVPRASLAAQAAAGGADLVVLGAGAALAHADWQLLRDCACPVLVARALPSGGYREILVPVDPMHAHDKPAALDDALIAAARALAHPGGAHLRLLHCYLPPQYLPLRAPGAATPAALQHGPGTLEAHRRALGELAARNGIAAADAVLESGDARQGIPDAVARFGTDLVVMGAVARSGLKRLLIGSTAEAVLGHLGCDVLAVRPPDA